MRSRFFLSGPLAALALGAAACTDQIPTLADGDFPPGSVPVTREVVFPASEFFRFLGSYSGYAPRSGAPYVVIANDYEGLHAHAATRFALFPTTIAYRRDGVERRDSLFTYTSSRLVLRVDTAASTPGPVTLRVWAAAQDWHPGSATWEAAVDTGSVRTPWAQPGGTRGDLLAEATFTVGPTGSDSLFMTLSGEATARLADTTSRGIIITAEEAGRRIELFDLVLRADVHPDSALPDTTIIVPVTTSGMRTTLYTPGQPEPGPGVIAVGGVRRARTLIGLDPRQRVPACPPPDAGCATVPLSEVRINQVALLLRPVDVPDGFDPLAPMPITLRMVLEPELGAAAPLGSQVSDRPVAFSVRDTLVALPITGLAAAMALNDTLPSTFALVSESEVTIAAPSFGVGFFHGEPMLRIIYTLPTRRLLP
jgi:hypothetical protein